MYVAWRTGKGEEKELEKEKSWKLSGREVEGRKVGKEQGE